MALILVWLALLLSCDNVANGASYERPCTGGPVPRVFTLGSSYPFCSEEEACGPIQRPITQHSTRFKELVRCMNPSAVFVTSNCRVMSARLHAMFVHLANEYYLTYGSKLTVIKSWTEYENHQALHSSLHYEG